MLVKKQTINRKSDLIPLLFHMYKGYVQFKLKSMPHDAIEMIEICIRLNKKYRHIYILMRFLDELIDLLSQ